MRVAVTPMMMLERSTQSIASARAWGAKGKEKHESLT